MSNEISQKNKDTESLPLRKDWSASVRNAVLNVIGIVSIAMLAGREALIEEGDVKDARLQRLECDLATTREELRLIGTRMKGIAPHRRPQYTMVERMAILELRALRGWSKVETARRFFVTADTVRSWLRRVDDDSLVETKIPVNRFPDFLNSKRYLIMDRDTKFCDSFRAILKDEGVESVKIPPRSPNLNSHLERFFGSLKSEALDRMIFFSEKMLRNAVNAYLLHYHEERNHQGLGNLLIDPGDEVGRDVDDVQCRERLGGLPPYYYRDAA